MAFRATGEHQFNDSLASAVTLARPEGGAQSDQLWLSVEVTGLRYKINGTPTTTNGHPLPVNWQGILPIHQDCEFSVIGDGATIQYQWGVDL